ncbi:hypothetical protein CISG_00509 [Coccidioides immitis RMSCC 3703]|uniref:Condensation domain-containing protein n=1 Tax=Coccidioides immitis RMSCC 3703 TaxID=454286 RepID=A0A0J8QIC6_COCIT|nr:hypothetical protein CISG_00509 [Coccidioides immitis RMSCC 3703]
MKDTHFQTSLCERTSKYWRTFLHDFKPCYFPSLLEGDGPSTSTTTTLQRGDFQDATVKLDNIYHSALQEFCSEHQVTLGSFFQTAWAVVVACYAGVEDISFGYLEGDNSDVVICRTDITAEQMLHQIMTDMMEHLENARTRPIGITEVQNLVGLEGQLLSDSALQIQRRGSEQSGSMSQADGNFDIRAHALINDDDSVAVAIRTKASKFSRSRTADVAHAFAKTGARNARPDLLRQVLDCYGLDAEHIQGWWSICRHRPCVSHQSHPGHRPSDECLPSSGAADTPLSLRRHFYGKVHCRARFSIP